MKCSSGGKNDVSKGWFVAVGITVPAECVLSLKDQCCLRRKSDPLSDPALVMGAMALRKKWMRHTVTVAADLGASAEGGIWFDTAVPNALIGKCDIVLAQYPVLPN